jgi:glucosamine-6-phosphate deaminase
VPVRGDAADLDAEVERLNTLLGKREVDICFAGIGENCHLAFNDPPADFEVDAPYIVVTLDDACRRQQMGEGWFPSLDAVPEHAVSMSIRQILKSKRVILSVPDARKAPAVRAAVETAISPDYPASVLQRHEDCTLYLDPPAASLLSQPNPH